MLGGIRGRGQRGKGKEKQVASQDSDVVMLDGSEDDESGAAPRETPSSRYQNSEESSSETASTAESEGEEDENEEFDEGRRRESTWRKPACD